MNFTANSWSVLAIWHVRAIVDVKKTLAIKVRLQDNHSLQARAAGYFASVRERRFPASWGFVPDEVR